MLFLMTTVKLMNNVNTEKAKKNLLADGIVGLETDFFWSRSWSRIFRTGLGLGLEPLWSRSRSSKLVSRLGHFSK